MDILAHNRAAWDREVEKKNVWTIPVSPEVIADARRGKWSVLLTETKPVPRAWFGELAGKDVLCLASGGGQQGPVLAAAGAHVTVLDLSPRQLASDRRVAQREGLELRTVEGDMADLSAFADESFDLVFHPPSNNFGPDVLPVWKEAARVLRHGGALLAGFLNPVEYCFDRRQADMGVFEMRFAVPYSDTRDISEQERVALFGFEAPLEFSHTLAELIGGQMEAGLLLTGLYEDYRKGDPIAEFMPSYIATRAVKP